MIILSNDFKFSFASTSGALAYDGKGWPWEWPFRYLGIMNPSKHAIITKSLTLLPQKGNLRWHSPFRCFRFIKGHCKNHLPGKGLSAVNAIALTNPGVEAIEAINTVPWKTIFPKQRSPLHKKGSGGLSGKIILPYSLEKIKQIKSLCQTPIIGAGGIMDKESALSIKKTGASAIAAGTIYMVKGPWAFNRLIKKLGNKF